MMNGVLSRLIQGGKVMRILSLIATVGLFSLAGCWTVQDYGFGKCREYRPWCWSGDEVCETGKRGCQLCTCVDHNGSFPMKQPGR